MLPCAYLLCVAATFCGGGDAAPTTAPVPATVAAAQVLPTTDPGKEARAAAAEAINASLQLTAKAPPKEARAALAAAVGEAMRGLGEGARNHARLEASLAAHPLPEEASGVEAERVLRRLRRELESASLDLSFEPRVEAPTPVGWPNATPVNELAILDYPTYRLARTSMQGATRGQNGAFWKLFRHIDSNKIAMTAPVEMSYTGRAGAEEPEWMAFLYANQAIGAPGTEGEVEIVDVPAARVLSIGHRGSMGERTMQQKKAELDAWLAAHPEWEVCGPMRSMGWNSPMVADARKYWELQVQVRLKERKT